MSPSKIKSVSSCWKPGESAAFAVNAKKVRFLEQYVRYEGEQKPGRHIFRFFWRTHWDRLGGGPKAETGAILESTDEYRPIIYELFSDRAALRRVSFLKDEAVVTLSDGSEFSLRLTEAVDFVFQNNVILQLSALLPMIRGIGRFSGFFFSPDTLGVKPLRLERQPDGRWTTNLGFTFACNDAGRIQSLSIPASGSSGEALDSAFPEVDWDSLRKPRTPEYRAPDAVEIRDVRIAGTVGIGGSLSLPKHGRPPYPAVLFIQGSGRHDRNGMAPGLDTGVHEIVDFLSAEGYAALRFDSRGVGTSGHGSPFESTMKGRLDDSRAALKLLAENPEVDANRIITIGHSLGAVVAMQLAAGGPPAVRGAVLLAPPGRRVDRILLEQADREGRRLGLSLEQLANRRKRFRERIHVAAESDAADLAVPQWGFSMSTLRDLMRVNPARLIATLKVPVLICQGAKDIHVSPARDAVPLFLAATRANVQADLWIFANCDHLFKEEPEQSIPSRYFVKRPVSTAFLRALKHWLDRVLMT